MYFKFIFEKVRQ